MEYLKNYKSFKESKGEEVNEGIMDMFKAATGSLKNFLGGITEPFKNLKNDFKKGVKFEEVKSRFLKSLDSILKSSTDGISKAKDEGELNQMRDSFVKEIEEQMVSFDNEIKQIKESKIFESAVKDAMIGGRVLFGMISDEIKRLKVEFDKKYAEAKDLNAKKEAAKLYVKTCIENAKKKINDEKLVKQATEEYKEKNNIEGGSGSEIETILKSYGVTKKEELVGKEVSYKTKKYDPNKKPEDQRDNVGTLKVLKITDNGLFFDGEKEDFEKVWDQIIPNLSSDPTEELTNNLKEFKEKKPENLKVLANIAKVLKDDTIKDKAVKIGEITKDIK